MYYAYEPQNQICVVPNGPVDTDHGFVLSEVFSVANRWDCLERAKAIVAVVCSISKTIDGTRLV
jgi:hypothetical protein